MSQSGLFGSPPQLKGIRDFPKKIKHKKKNDRKRMSQRHDLPPGMQLCPQCGRSYKLDIISFHSAQCSLLCDSENLTISQRPVHFSRPNGNQKRFNENFSDDAQDLGTSLPSAMLSSSGPVVFNFISSNIPIGAEECRERVSRIRKQRYAVDDVKHAAQNTVHDIAPPSLSTRRHPDDALTAVLERQEQDWEKFERRVFSKQRDNLTLGDIPFPSFALKEFELVDATSHELCEKKRNQVRAAIMRWCVRLLSGICQECLSFYCGFMRPMNRGFAFFRSHLSLLVICSSYLQASG